MLTTTTASGYRVAREGSLYLVTPLDAEAKSHLAGNVSDEAQWFGASLVVESRYVFNLVADLLDEGFEVT